VTTFTKTEERDAPKARPTINAKKFSWTWLGVVPFFVFALAFLFLPTLNLFVGAFQDDKGNFTLQNIIHLFQPFVLHAYAISIEVSLLSAFLGGMLGFLLAYAITIGGIPGWLRSAVLTFSGVASNFAGVPLAFAFIATLGRVGMLTVFLKQVFGINLYSKAIGFDLYGFLGLSLTYMYFQLPLMVLVITPALDGLKREWREASENLGANSRQYWQHIALPILLPSLLATTVLLFGNAFGAYATAYALTGGNLQLVTIVIGAQIQGDVLHDPGLGYALALGMVVIMALSIAAYSYLQSRTSRWQR
jgi:putative spermidine/putrescine transport system permease protein